jgi:AcrR family transcriptional regulator
MSRADRILFAAGEVFLEKGFEAATTLDVAKRARVSKRDLYKHFESKQGIIEALIAAHSTQLSIPPDLGDPRDLNHLLAILAAFGPVFLRSLLDPRKVALYRVAITEAPRSTKLGLALAEAGAGPVIASSTAFMTKAVMRGIVREADARFIMTSYFDVLIGPWQLRLLTGTHAFPDDATIRAQADAAVEAVRRMILAGSM